MSCTSFPLPSFINDSSANNADYSFRRAQDKSTRYVAEENVARMYDPPCENLMLLAGRYFKRWSVEKRAFVSNIRDEYPDD